MATPTLLRWDTISTDFSLKQLIEIMNRRRIKLTIPDANDTTSDLPGDIPGIAWDWNADKEVEAGHSNGEALARATDQTGLLHHAVSISGKELVLEENSSDFNGHACFDMNNNKGAMTETAFMRPTDDCTVYYVGKRTGAHVEHGQHFGFVQLPSPGSSSNFRIKESNHIWPSVEDDRFQFASDGYSIAAIDTRAFVLALRFAGHTLNVFYDGVLKEILDATTGVSVGTDLVFGGGSSVENFSAAKIGGGLVGGGNGNSNKTPRCVGYEGAHTDDQIQKISDIFAVKYCASTDALGGDLYSTTGLPADNVGQDGDWALDTATLFLYGQKNNGTWPTGYIDLSGGGTSLDDLSDVVITAAATGDILRHNGTNWVDYPDSNYAAASHTHTTDDLTDWDNTSRDAGDVATWDGSNWVPAPPGGGTGGSGGVPSGGATGDVLTKASATNYDTEWTSPTSSGSFTPGIAFGGGTTSLTYTTQLGRYVRLKGNVVHAWLYIQINNKGSSTGAATITGLPFTTKNTSNQFQAGSVGLFSGTAAAITAWADPNSTSMSLRRQSADASLTDAQVINGAQIIITLIYECEP